MMVCHHTHARCTSVDIGVRQCLPQKSASDAGRPCLLSKSATAGCVSTRVPIKHSPRVRLMRERGAAAGIGVHMDESNRNKKGGVAWGQLGQGRGWAHHRDRRANDHGRCVVRAPRKPPHPPPFDHVSPPHTSTQPHTPYTDIGGPQGLRRQGRGNSRSRQRASARARPRTHTRARAGPSQTAFG